MFVTMDWIVFTQAFLLYTFKNHVFFFFFNNFPTTQELNLTSWTPSKWIKLL